MLKLMKILAVLFATFLAVVSGAAETTQTVYQSDFTKPLGKEWHWGLGTWETRDGILHAYESGPRRHGPIKMQKLTFTDATFVLDAQFIGRAHWASVVFNDQKGHLFIVTLSRSGQKMAVVKPSDKSDPSSKQEIIAETPLKLKANRKRPPAPVMRRAARG
jgi:hypothetical protein